MQCNTFGVEKADSKTRIFFLRFPSRFLLKRVPPNGLNQCKVQNIRTRIFTAAYYARFAAFKTQLS